MEVRKKKLPHQPKLSDQNEGIRNRNAAYRCQRRSRGIRTRAKWFLNLKESGVVKKKLTRFGEGIGALRMRAREWFEQQWLRQLNEGKSFKALKDMDQTPWRDLLLSDQKPEDMRASVYRQFETSRKDRLKDFVVLTRPEDVGFWEMNDGKIRIFLHFRYSLMKDGDPPVATRTVEGYAVVETRQPIDPESFDFASPPPDWSLVSFTFTHFSPPTPNGVTALP